MVETKKIVFPIQKGFLIFQEPFELFNIKDFLAYQD